MTRRHDWPEILSAHIEAQRDRPGVWGTNDCATNPADLGMAMGHGDILDGLRGYASARQAAAKLKEAGYRNLAEMVAARMDEVPLGMARRGDVALCFHDGKRGIYRYTLAVIGHDGFLYGPGEAGQVRWPRNTAQRAFRFR